MKKIFKLSGISFMVILLVSSCQDVIDGGNDSYYSMNAETRTGNENCEKLDYYWSKGEKHYLKQVSNKTYVLYKAEKRERLFSTLSEDKISYDSSKIMKYNNKGTDECGNAALNFVNCEWIEINKDFNSLSDDDVFLYTAPYYCILEGGEPFPMKN